MTDLSVMGAGAVPTAAFLDARARTLRDKPTGRAWVCPLCGYRNNPVDNLLIKLPPFKCSNPDDINCPGKCPATPEFSIADCVINGVRTDFLIRDQGPYPTCAAHTLLHGMDAELRVERARRGVIVATGLNGADLLGKYYVRVGSALGYEDEIGAKKRIPCLLQVAQSDGVEYMAPIGSVPTGRKLRVSSWFYLRTDGDMNFVIRLIASGFPLLTSMRTGRCLTMTNDGELYMSPDITRKNHAVALIGCCVKPVWLQAEDGTSKLVEKFLLKARDSKGDRVHTSGTYVGTGGDIYLLVEDLGSHFFGFHLELPSWMQ